MANNILFNKNLNDEFGSENNQVDQNNDLLQNPYTTSSNQNNPSDISYLEDLRNQYINMSKPNTDDQLLLEQARQQKQQSDLYNLLTQSSEKLGRSLAGAKEPIDYSGYNQMAKSAQDQVSNIESNIKNKQERQKNTFQTLKDLASESRAQNYLDIQKQQEDRSAQKFGIDLQESKLKLDQIQKQRDPSSDISKSASDALAAAYPEDRNKFQNKSYDELSAMAPLFDKKYDRILANKKLDIEKENKDLLAQLKILSKQDQDRKDQENKDFKASEALDKKITKYSETLQKTGIPDISAAIEAVTKALPEKGMDIPGQGATGGLPDFMVSQPGKDLRGKLATLFNITLKQRSGAAVTDHELERMRQEFQNNKWNNDESLRKGINNYISRLQELSKNIIAGTKPDAKKAYEEQGGSNYNDLLKQYRYESESKLYGRFDNKTEDAIKQFMEDNNITSKKEAIDILKKAGKLK